MAVLQDGRKAGSFKPRKAGSRERAGPLAEGENSLPREQAAYRAAGVAGAGAVQPGASRAALRRGRRHLVGRRADAPHRCVARRPARPRVDAALARDLRGELSPAVRRHSAGQGPQPLVHLPPDDFARGRAAIRAPRPGGARGDRADRRQRNVRHQPDAPRDFTAATTGRRPSTRKTSSSRILVLSPEHGVLAGRYRPSEVPGTPCSTEFSGSG